MQPLVGILMGSKSDAEIMSEASKILDQFDIPHEARILSAHRSPHATLEYVETAASRGIKVLIAGAGAAAHLAGFLAAHTVLPVIGVPIDSSPLKGMDALLATVQMPPGVPVGCMAIGKPGARNAGLFAVAILALGNPDLAEKLRQFRSEMEQEIVQSSIVRP
ncbi:MAG TPA: 5-(carboxyamino)imidazole ribonucleotide mutase [Acidobacteriota bacterium]|jgi:phosphoribosylaminoimidazole carboxylase PurE protein|nr:5-(carboxyamino)imidazole ribonucleotide mutase [Acidobacteriota bacterium]